MIRSIYVASSWRNPTQPLTVELLRGANFEVYDFQNPAIGEHGFSWREVDPDFHNWTTIRFIEILDEPIAERAFKLDFDAMKACDACVLLLPSGRSAHIEAGWFTGVGKPLFIFIPTVGTEPELMYKLASGGVFHNLPDLIAAATRYGS